MKKIYLFCLVLCTNLCVSAQVTSLTIDNQTPGWLSSKIDYADQQTVRNLKVTGYINDTDLKFIGSLLSQSLNGTLDLGDVNIIGNSWNGLFSDSKDYNEPESSLYKLVLPSSLTNYEENSQARKNKVEIFIFDTKVNKIKRSMLRRDFQHIIIGENVDSIEKYGLYASWYLHNVKSVTLPSSLKYIGDFAFQDVLNDLSTSNISEFPNLEYIGYEAFANTNGMSISNKETLPDTLRFPKIKEYHISAFDYKEGMHIYLGENIERVYDDRYTYSDEWYPSLKNITFHFASITPPISSNDSWNKDLTVYVPKEAVDKYKKKYSGWEYANILAEPVPLERIELKEHEIILDIDESYQLSAAPIPANADNATISWKSSNEDIAIVSETGLVTAISSGKACIIVASTDGSKKDTCNIIVKTHVESVAIQQNSVSMSNIGETKQLGAVITPDDATDKSVKWESSNKQVCTVSNSGLVTATGVGTALVTVTTIDGGHTATCVVKVLQHVSGVSVDKHSISLKVGEKGQIEVNVSPDNADERKVIWTTSNEVIASVSENGLVTALKAGEAWIKATSVDNSEAKDSCLVTVIQPVTGIMLSEATYELNSIGQTVQLKATVMPKDASNKAVTWKSSDTSICLINNGNVVATGFGVAVVMATTDDGGYGATCVVTVKDLANGVSEVEVSKNLPVYDLMGRKVMNTRKGSLYLRGGKKFIAK